MNTQEADLNWHPFRQNAYEFKSPGEIRGCLTPQPHFEPSGVRVADSEKGIILIVFNSQHSEIFFGGLP